MPCSPPGMAQAVLGREVWREMFSLWHTALISLGFTEESRGGLRPSLRLLHSWLWFPVFLTTCLML